MNKYIFSVLLLFIGIGLLNSFGKEVKAEFCNADDWSCSMLETQVTCPDGCSGSECARIYAKASNCGINGGVDSAVDTPLPVIIGRLVRALFGFLGTAFLILIIYGGFVWMTAAGNEENVNKAKKIITQATIGLFVVVISYALSDFIFDSILQATNGN